MHHLSSYSACLGLSSPAKFLTSALQLCFNSLLLPKPVSNFDSCVLGGLLADLVDVRGRPCSCFGQLSYIWSA